MTHSEIDNLFSHNVQQINKMYLQAGALVQQLLLELERDGRNTYIRLSDPAERGHTVSYEFVEGDTTLVGRAGRALGFKTVTDSTLEVHSA